MSSPVEGGCIFFMLSLLNPGKVTGTLENIWYMMKIPCLLCRKRKQRRNAGRKKQTLLEMQWVWLPLCSVMLLVANFANTKWFKKTEKQLKPWHIGTHITVLKERFSINTKEYIKVCFLLLDTNIFFRTNLPCRASSYWFYLARYDSRLAQNKFI